MIISIAKKTKYINRLIDKSREIRESTACDHIYG